MVLFSVVKKFLLPTVVVFILILAATGSGSAVGISTSINFGAPDGAGSTAWSPDGELVMLAEIGKSDQRQHLCIYSVKERRKIKCIYYLAERKADLEIYGIDWTDDYIHVSIGFAEGATVVHRLPIPEWKENSFRELNIESYKPLSETYGYPAWDKWERGLFFFGEDERYGIQFIPYSGKVRKYVSGAYPAVTRRYLWYTNIIGDDLMLDGISLIDKVTQKRMKLTSGHLDVSVSPRRDEKAALFIRKEHGSNKSALYAYSDGVGIVGPLLSADLRKNEEFNSVKLSPDGKYALLTTSFSPDYDEFKTVTTIKLLSMRW
jgi:hypothetical protein